jgi:hypothetical protein
MTPDIPQDLRARLALLQQELRGVALECRLAKGASDSARLGKLLRLKSNLIQQILATTSEALNSLRSEDQELADRPKTIPVRPNPVRSNRFRAARSAAH